MTDFTRLTIIASARKAEVVIPNDESIGGLIPRLMDLLGEAPASVARPLTLVRGTGEQLDSSQSAGEQEVADGELLRLVRQDDAPPPPEVADVTDVLAETHADRAGLWSTRTREITGAVAIGGFACALSLLARLDLAVLGVGAAVCVLAAVLVGRMGSRWGATALTAAALGAVPALAAALTAGLAGALRVPAAGVPPLTLGLVAGLGWTAIGLGFGVGAGRRPAVQGSAIGVGLVLLPLALLALGIFGVGTVAVTGVVAVIGCGVLPWYAMTASGLTGLDDQVVEGRPRRRGQVLGTVNDAYRALNWTIFAVAVPIAVAIAVLGSSGQVWAVGLALAIALVTALRTRAFPLAVEQMTLWFAAGAGTIYALIRSPLLEPGWSAAILGALGVLTALAVALRPAPHRRASLRRLGSLLEALAMIALIPLLLGSFGLYADLLRAFG